MVAASVQALSCAGKGIIKLDPGFCSWVDKEFREELGSDAKKWLPPPLK
jgi:hypothetical protein